MAGRLLESLLTSGYASAPSGSVRFFQPGTTAPITVYRDDALTQVITQPVALDGFGRSVYPIYLKAPARAIFYSSSGAQLLDVERIDGDRAELVSLANAKWPTESTVDALATALGASLGGMDGNFMATGSGAVGRPLQSRLSEMVFSVKDYGAKGDGLTDDTGAFNAAFAAAKGAGDATVDIPSGTYILTQAITVTSFTGLTVRGAGFGASQLKQNTAATNVFTFSSCTGLRLYGFNMFALAANTGTAISLSNCTNVEIVGVGVDVLSTTNSFDLGIATSGTCSFVWVQECSFQCNNAAAARAFKSTGSLSRAWILNSLMSVGASGIPIEFTQTNAQVVIGGCPISGGSTGISWAASVVGSGGYTIYGCFLSTLYTQPFTVGVATDPNIRQWGNQNDGFTVDIATNGTMTPDRSRGNYIRFRITSTGGAGATIAAPTPTPTSSMRGMTLTLSIFNNAGGAITAYAAINAVYHLTATPSLNNLDITTYTLLWDPDALVWRDIARTVTT